LSSGISGIAIHTDHIKLTKQIVTTKGALIRKELLESIYRGITITEGYGGSQEKKQIIMMVVTSYETAQIKKIVRNHDENAFINILEIFFETATYSLTQTNSSTINDSYHQLSKSLKIIY
jgi:uncharacterized membrane-anchored protein YitT (DUF2179 family)